MKQHRPVKRRISRSGHRRAALAVSAGLAVIAIAAWWLHGRQFAVLHAAGPIAAQQKQLMVLAVGLATVIVLPVFVLLFVIAWRYRASNTRASYRPDWDGSRITETVWWLIPAVIIAYLSVVTWNSTHALDPYKPLASSVKPVPVQVVALQWRWLFIYPDSGVACLNDLRMPTGTPVNFAITADAPMNSFWIPQLGGQVYAMAGMTTQLHLQADQPGSYRGSSANLSGSGFAGMNFAATASTPSDYRAWLERTKTTAPLLDSSQYANLAKPAADHIPSCYRLAANNLFDTIVASYMHPNTDVTSGSTQTRQPSDPTDHLKMHNMQGMEGMH